MGGDTINITGGGGPDSPLVIFGDTSQDGSRYDGDPSVGLVTGNAVYFSNHGNDIIDASDSIYSVTIYGGAGDDTINGSQAGDHLAGGSGDDEIHGRGGIDHIYGDSGINADYTVVIDEDGNHTVSRLLSVPFVNESIGLTLDDLVSGSDTIYGDSGNDIVFGDHGIIEHEAGILRLLTTDHVVGMETSAEENGADDTIYGNDDDDVIFGGNGDDRLNGDTGRDLIFGDHAVLTEKSDATSGRYRILSGSTIYGEDADNDGEPLVTDDPQNNPDGSADWAVFNIVLDGYRLVDDSDSINADSFGSDYIAGGAGDDTLFGQIGNDTIQGDGSIDYISSGGNYNGIGTDVGAKRDEVTNTLLLNSSFEDISDGDDYIEGNSGDDVIFGNLGQDDIIGGSSNLFVLTAQPDDSDIIFGGAGTDIDRNDLGDTTETGHARDADMILGDNGNIYLLIYPATGQYLTFGYDNYLGTLRIIPRAAELLDYTPGNQDAQPTDLGAGDEIHGESGDDFIYGMVGNDIIFGEGQDDDLIGGWGHDWISGGTGDDGVLGDDGRIYTSRDGTAEPLYGIDDLAGQLDLVIAGPGNSQQATINVTGQLKKSVNLTPFNVDSEQDPLYEALNADDIIYGGLGNDWLHGGSGDDAISGAEALEEFYNNPANDGDYLGYDPETATFTYFDFDQDDLLLKIEGFRLNFEAAADDGDDVLFGDLGNDWLVGGTDNDHLYGGYGTDVLNVDDNLETNGGLNNVADPDNNDGIDDTAVGGAGRDALIANTLADRLIDWTGEFNNYRVPFSIFGKYTVSRRCNKGLLGYLYQLSEADGADQTLGLDADPGRDRKGEPFGELGLVTQKDPGWHEQTGRPIGPQAGNTTGNKKK
jgi:Ca2+-binding RTX toxin-like protein